jgi:TonB family protein
MSTMAAWLIYCGVVGAVLTAGAFAWEYSARWSGRPARWGWITALAGSVTLPWLLRLVPERAWPEMMPAALHALPTAPVLLEPIAMAGDGPAAVYWNALEFGIFAWAVLSVLMLAWLGWAVASIAVSRREWRATELDGERVFISGDTGPAALGLREGLVVVPAWALELRDDVRALLLAHEREHVHAGDPRLLFGGLLCVAAMPWNPLVWVQLLRLRNAIELDCDARVLARGVNPRAYGTLLLEVGRRRGSSPLVMATFAEPRVFLEERIRRIAKWPLQRSRGRAAAFAVLALVLFATALSARDPLRPGAGAVRGVELLPLGGAARAETLELDPAGNPIYRDMEPIHAVDPDVAHGAALEVRPLPLMASDTPPAGRRVEDGPVFTPMTVRPELRNPEEVARSLSANYPASLRDAGIGGTVDLWFYIDAEGTVRDVRLAQSSRYPALDEAALLIAPVMRFSPAMNRDARVAVWVQVPLTFSARARQQPAAADRAGLLRERLDAAPPPVAAPQRGEAQARTTRPAGGAPRLLNVADVQRELVRGYPPLLRDAGIGGTVVAYLYVDASGSVQRVQLGASSGHSPLDEAALGVSRLMRFAPGTRDGAPAAAWVALPISYGGAAVPLLQPAADIFPHPPIPVEGRPGTAADAPGTVRLPLLRTEPPPPAAGDAVRDIGRLAERPVFTPMTVRPELRNVAEVQRVLIRSYPPMLRDAGIGGTAVVWFLIDDNGRVVQTRLSNSSGYTALDDAALAVAEAMLFSPALLRETRVPVWIEVPVVFAAGRP